MSSILRKIRNWPVDVFNVWKREVSLAFHDEAVIIFFLVLCAVYPILYSLVYNTEVARDMKVIVVDDSRSQLSRQFVRELDATPDVAVMDYVSNMQDAHRLMNEHECYGILYFPRDFSTNVVSGQQGHISLYCDMGVLFRYKQMLSALTNVQEDICGKINAKKITLLSHNTGAVIKSRQVPLGNTGIGLASAVLPFVLIMVLQQSMILGICVLRGGSRERRLLNKGIDPLEVKAGVGASIVGKTLCHFMIYVVLMVYVLHFVPMFFDFPQNGNILDIFILMCPFLLAASFMGQTLQVFVNDRESAFLVIVFSSILFIFLTGVSWPRYLMSPYWLAVGNVLPSTWAANGYIAVQTSGATLDQIPMNFKMLWLLAAIYFVAAYLVEKVICRPRYRRMQGYAAIDPDALIKEECRRNAVDYRNW